MGPRIPQGPHERGLVKAGPLQHFRDRNYNFHMVKSGDFKERVLRVVSEIPRGKTLTYKEVAEISGSPRAFRAVGNIMKSNRNPNVPCHRVIRSDGNVGGYNAIGGSKKKKEILKREGAI